MFFSNKVCFVQLQNQLNEQHDELMKAQQTALVVRHQHKDAVVRDIAELQASTHRQSPHSAATASVPVFSSDRCDTSRTGVENSRYVTEVNERHRPSMSLTADTHGSGDTGSPQAPNIRHKPVVFKPSALAHKTVGSSGYVAESFVSSAVPRSSDNTEGQHTVGLYNAGISQAPNIDHEPVVLKPTVLVCTNVVSSGRSAESLGHRMTADITGGKHTADAVSDGSEVRSQQSSRSAFSPVVMKSSSRAEMDSNSPVKQLHASPAQTVSELSATNWPVNSSHVYMSPLTVSVTTAVAPVINSQSASLHYFERLDSLPLSDSSTSSSSGLVSEETFSSNLPLKKPNCVFASKSVIANMYLSRRHPLFSPVHAATQLESVDGEPDVVGHVNNIQSNYPAPGNTSPPTKLSDNNRLSTSRLSATALTSPLVPPRLSSGHREAHSFSSLSSPRLKLDEDSLQASPQMSKAKVPSDINSNVGVSSSTDSPEHLFTDSQLTAAIFTSSSSLPLVVTSCCTSVPLHMSSVSGVLSSVASVSSVPSSVSGVLSLSSSVSDVSSSTGSVSSLPKVPFEWTNLPILVSSDLSASVDRASQKPLVEAIHCNTVTTLSVPSLSDAIASSPHRLSCSAADTGAVLSAGLVAVSSASSEMITVAQSAGLERQHLTRLFNGIPSSLTMPHLSCATMPCTLTISTHVPVSSHAIDTVASSLDVTSSDVVNSAVFTVSSSINVSGVSDVIPRSVSLSPVHSMPSSLASCIRCDGVSDSSSSPDLHNLPEAPLLYSSLSTMATSDGVHASCISSASSHTELQNIASDLLQPTNDVAVVDQTTAELTTDKHKSTDDTVAAESAAEVETKNASFNEASLDDASSDIVPLEGEPDPLPALHTLVTKLKHRDRVTKTLQRVSFCPLTLLLDASLEGDLELVMNTAKKVIFSFCNLLLSFCIIIHLVSFPL